jgi:hypothetical protein
MGGSGGYSSVPRFEAPAERRYVGVYIQLALSVSCFILQRRISSAIQPQTGFQSFGHEARQ